MSLPKPLMFTVGLVDQITKPIANITKQFNGLADTYQAGTMQMATGLGGMAASGMALHSALMPAIEIDRKLGDIKGLGVADDALKAVTSTAFDFAIEYGQAATDVLAHTEKLRASMGDMPAHVMQSATASSATLAMAMKSDADTVTNYFKTLYGNYQGQADAMGKDNFIAQITGMTAMAKQQFGTSMQDMEGMLDGMHSLPSTLGVALDEQFAVLGMLGQQMGQGDAVTQYTNYLEGVAGAQEKLGVRLTDAKGNLLPMVEVIEKIKPMIEGMSGIQARTFLDDAGLGDGALAIINMSKNLDGLKANINSFKNVKGMGPATDMARDMTDQSQRLAQSWNVIRAAFGSAVLPAFNGFASWIADMGKDVLWFTETFPNLTRWLGYAAIAMFGLVAAGGAFTVMMGAAKMAMTTWNLSAMVSSGIYKILTLDMARLSRQMKLIPYFMQRWARTSKVAAAAQWALNLAMNANPVGLVVTGIAALIGVVGLAVYYFDDLREMMVGTAWGEPILFAVDAIAGLLKTLGGIVMSVFGGFFTVVAKVFSALKPLASFLIDVVVFNLKIMASVWGVVFGAMAYGLGGLASGITWVVTTISDGFTWAFEIVSSSWNDLVSWFTNDAWVQYLFGKVSNIGQFFSSMLQSIKETFAGTWSWIADKLNMLPGINIDVTPVMENMPKQQVPDFIKNHNQQAVPQWMQQTAANETAMPKPMAGPWAASMDANPIVPATNITRLPVEYQQSEFKPVMPESLTQTVNQQRGQILTEPPAPLMQTVDLQRSALPVYQPDATSQQLNIKPVANESVASAIKPRFNEQTAANARASMAASSSGEKRISFGDVIINNPPKNFSLAEIADQQELMTA
ncbi:phage tail tape measure protein [Shewanella halifaxensis]|uniref:phage tail tape measure protein n=1 Tax=Shewanella halifaxensis TaxID=271098 RepID=UPI000D59AC8D|nr:phage tail tape measure protein [Shewanella halifaxensis]